MSFDFLYRRRNARNLAPWQPILHGIRPLENVKIENQFTSSLPDRADGPRRAANRAYWIGQSIPQPDAEDIPHGVQLMPDTARGYSRAARAAYLIVEKGLAEDRNPELGSGYMDVTPRPPRRATAWQYWFENRLALPEELPPGLNAFFARPLFRRGTGLDIFIVRTQYIIPDDAIPIQAKVYDPQRQARRPDRQSYWLRNVLQIAEPPLLPEGAIMPTRPRGALRAALSAYAIGGVPTPDVTDEPAPDPGCPSRSRRNDEDSTMPERLDEDQATYPQRCDEDSSAPTRIDECR